MNDKRALKQTEERKGAAAVEFALAAPIFFALFFGAIEITRVNQINNTAEIAATEGARRGIIPGASTAECIAIASDEMQAAGISNFTVRTFPPQITDSTSTIRVQIDVPLGPQNGIFVTQFFTNQTASRSIELVRED